MKKTTIMTTVAVFLAGQAFAVQAPIGAAAPTVDRLGKAAAAENPEAAMDCLYDAHCAGGTVMESPVAAPQAGEMAPSPRAPVNFEAPSLTLDVPTPAVEGLGREQVPYGLWTGVKNGARAGGTLGFGESSPRDLPAQRGLRKRRRLHRRRLGPGGRPLRPALIVGAAGGAIGAVVGAGQVVSPDPPAAGRSSGTSSTDSERRAKFRDRSKDGAENSIRR